MKNSMLGLALSALLATVAHAQTATPVVQPAAPAVLGTVITEQAAAPQTKAAAKKAKKVKKANKTAKKGAKKAAVSHGKHAPKLSAKAKKHHKLQA